eukprot:TRINITY_DN68120_c1_g7_i2.p1 TRINITY_DN68120_c1_g7~~TRINITY_DN68120_c1_g7_i2.p1  ORF type:complete len:304 (+),score=17.75 TRINITY_DN68120_c1_g7_i2:218-1129(+)
MSTILNSVRYRYVHTNTHVHQEQWEYALATKKEYEQVAIIASFDQKDWANPKWVDNVLESLKHAFANGALGVKTWKDIGMEFTWEGEYIMTDNKRFDPIYDYIERENKTLVCHCGEPKNCWLPIEEMTTNNDKEYFKGHPQYHMHDKPEVPHYDEQLKARDNVLDKHPGVRFMGCHLGTLEWDVDVLGKWLDAHPKACVDFAHRMPHLEVQAQKDADKVSSFLKRYQKQLAYGTDIQIHPHFTVEETSKLMADAWHNDWEFLATSNKTMSVPEVTGEFRAMELDWATLEQIYSKTALAWFPGI